MCRAVIHQNRPGVYEAARLFLKELEVRPRRIFKSM